jgi:hypothetical protein
MRLGGIGLGRSNAAAGQRIAKLVKRRLGFGRIGRLRALLKRGFNAGCKRGMRHGSTSSGSLFDELQR